jgi:RNA-directed DNA polymerase
VVLCADRAGIAAAQAALEQFLATVGLQLHPTKTRLTHSLESVDGAAPGFDFLGFTIRQHRVGRYRSGKRPGGRGRLGFKTLIKPSKASIHRHAVQTGAIVRAHRGLPQQSLICRLNPVITGWARYFRTIAASKAYRTCDLHLYNQLRSWAYWRHPTKNRGWIVRKYWTWQPGNRWRFSTPGGKDLRRHSDVSILPHVKVRGAASPYDGNLVYWSRRLTHHPLARSRESTLLRRQAGRCPHCGLTFQDGDTREIDHISPGGGEQLANLQLLHRHCHDQKTTQQTDHRRRRCP